MTYLESVDNSLRLLQLLADRTRIRVSEAAAHLGVAPSTAHRLLSTLRFRGFVVQSRDRSYRAGPALEELVSHRIARSSMAELAVPALSDLRDATNESSHLAVLVGHQLRIIASAESHQPLRVGSRSGVMLPAHLTAGGRMLLAELNATELDALYPPEGLPNAGLTEADMVALRRDLARCRTRGYALNTGQTERGITVVGVLIAEEEDAVGALSVSYPSVRFDRAELPHIVTTMRSAAARVALQLRASGRSSNAV